MCECERVCVCVRECMCVCGVGVWGVRVRIVNKRKNSCEINKSGEERNVEK